MDKEKILELAYNEGAVSMSHAKGNDHTKTWTDYTFETHDLMSFANAIEAEVKERCVKICLAVSAMQPSANDGADGAIDCAIAIREMK